MKFKSHYEAHYGEKKKRAIITKKKKKKSKKIRQSVS